MGIKYVNKIGECGGLNLFKVTFGVLQIFKYDLEKCHTIIDCY